MIDLELEEDEGIIVQAKDVFRYGANDEEVEIQEMYLTNKNLICVYDNSSGIFSSENLQAEKIPLDEIKIVNDKIQVSKVDNDDYGLCLQILFKKQSRKLFEFSKSKDIDIWKNAIISTISGEPFEQSATNENDVKSKFKNVINSTKKFTDKVQETRKKSSDLIVGTSSEVMQENIEQPKEQLKQGNEIESVDEKIETEDIAVKDKEKEREKPSKTEKEIFCQYCGEPIPANSKFCNSCGKPLKENNNEEKEASDDIQSSKRKEEYVGTIMKCPNCGETLKSFEINCPSCGFEIRGAKNSNAVEKLSAKLEEIERTREKKKSNAILRLYNLDDPITKTDEQKISVIRNFPIPNTKEDLYEFLILSRSNIDINSYTNQGFNTARKAISDAWKAKYDQAYQKAKLLLKDDERLADINKMYSETEKSISKSKNQIWIILGVTFGIIFLTIIIMIPAMLLINDSLDDSQVNDNSQVNDTSQVNDNSKEKEKNKEKKNTNEISEVELNKFTKGYEKAIFEKYNSFASENGLGGKRIYFKCKLDRTEVLEADETKTIIGYVTDENDNKWLIHLHFIPAVSAKYFDNYINKEMYLRGVYEGYSSVKEMPSVTMDELLIVETGEEIPGMQQIIDKGDN